MWLESRSGGWSIARSRAEVLAGQTDLSGAKTVLTLAEAIETTRIHRVAGLTGDRTAQVATRPYHAPDHSGSSPLPTKFSVWICSFPFRLRHALSFQEMPVISVCRC
jgi:hypothetical protein